jgi:4-amino-4-deoxychorismate lyase
MFQFIETVKLLDGQFHHLDYHQRRVNQTMAHFFKKTSSLDLESYLAKQQIPATGLYKCRIIYAETSLSIEFLPYTMKPIRSLKVVHDETIDYAFKFEQRSQLIQLFEKRGNSDEIIIVKRNLVTDASYANLAFYDGKEWVTPSSHLLNGTMQQILVDQQKIRSTPISLVDIATFEKVKLINSMLGFDGFEIPVSQIVY